MLSTKFLLHKNGDEMRSLLGIRKANSLDESSLGSFLFFFSFDFSISFVFFALLILPRVVDSLYGLTTDLSLIVSCRNSYACNDCKPFL